MSDTKARLNQTFDKKDAVDVALATNMISVGLDVTRLDLMLVSGQPKTVGEYIQATSRVGRDPNRPGLVVALLNVNKPRDRSHYERFSYWHAAFYRAVEATSVTPFAPRALDRGLAAVVVAMARLAEAALTPNPRAADADQIRPQLNWIADVIRERVIGHKPGVSADVAARVRARAVSLLDDWSSLANDRNSDGTTFGYGREPGISKTLLTRFWNEVSNSPTSASAASEQRDRFVTSSPRYYCARSRRTAPRSTRIAREGFSQAEPGFDDVRARGDGRSSGPCRSDRGTARLALQRRPRGGTRTAARRQAAGQAWTALGAIGQALHSLAHMLLTRISLDCGYPAAALRERIYALSDVGMYGILLHTGTSGSEGTLGGLVESGRRIGEHLLAAIEEARLCSNDPVCAEHDTSAEHDPYASPRRRLPRLSVDCRDEL